jgi:hypothetical protein
MTARHRVFLKTSLALLAAIALSGCVHYQGATVDHHKHHMAQHNARLGELVDAMNAAEGAAKVDAIAAVVNELAAPRIHPHGCGHDDCEAGDCDCPRCPHRSASRSLD